MADPKRGRSIRKRLYDLRSYLDLERALADIENKTIEQIRRDLEAAREETIARLTQLTGTMDIAKAQQILAELERQEAQFDILWPELFQDALDKAWNTGAEQATVPFTGTAIEISVRPFISTQFLEVAAATMPDLIKAMTAEWRADIGRLLRRATLGQLSVLDLIREIGELPPLQTFDEKTKRFRPLSDADIRKALRAKGPHAKLFNRMEAIGRTEIGRISQSANYLTLRELATNDPRYQKEWASVIDGRTRPSHRRADGQRRKVDEPYIVGGERMQYPLDPRASAANTVNCRCISIPWHPIFDEGPDEAEEGGLTPKLPSDTTGVA